MIMILIIMTVILIVIMIVFVIMDMAMIVIMIINTSLGYSLLLFDTYGIQYHSTYLGMKILLESCDFLK